MSRIRRLISCLKGVLLLGCLATSCHDAPARTLDVYVRGGPATNDVSYGLNELFPVPFRQVEDIFSAMAGLDKHVRIRVIVDETVPVGTLSAILQRARDFGLDNCDVIARALGKAKFPSTVISGGTNALFDTSTWPPPSPDDSPPRHPAVSPHEGAGDTNHWILSTITTYDLTAEQRRLLKRAALSSNDLNAALSLRCYFMTVRRDPKTADLWLKFMAFRGDPRARQIMDEQRYLVSESEMRILDASD